MTKSENQFLQGPILLPLMKFVAPIFFALMLQAAYSSVDMWVVGRFCGPADISAVSSGSQVILIITGLITGLSTGSTIVIAKYFAQKKQKETANAIGTTIRIFFILAIVITAITLPLSDIITHFVNAPEGAFEKTKNYIAICASGIVFITGYNLISGIFRGFGNSKTPLFFVAIACTANILLDLLFVALLGMDSSGTAIATIMAQALSLFCSYIYMKKKGLPVPFSKENLKRDKMMEKEILKIGSPLAAQSFFNGFSFLIITALVNSLGLIESASVGVAEKIFYYMFLIPLSMTSAVSTFVAQNTAVNQYDRAKKSVWICFGISLVLASILFYAGFFHGDILASIFTSDTAVITGAAMFLMATSIESASKAFESPFSGYLSGAGHTTFVMWLGLISTFLVRIPIAYFVVNSANPTLFKLGMSAASAAIFSLIGFVGYYFILNRKKVVSFI